MSSLTTRSVRKRKPFNNEVQSVSAVEVQNSFQLLCMIDLVRFEEKKSILKFVLVGSLPVDMWVKYPLNKVQNVP